MVLRRFCVFSLFSLFSLVILVSHGCGDDPDASIAKDASSSDGGGEPDGAGSPDAGRSDEDAPRILVFSTNVDALEPDVTLRFTAVVTDPQGIGDVIGGTLSAPGAGDYGSFTTSADEGTYGLALHWDDINDVEPIYTNVGGSPRVFRATFFDQAGHFMTQDITIDLDCGDEQSACAGECFSLQTDEHNCGACGRNCEHSLWTDDISPREEVCRGGTCTWAVETSQRASCDDVCGQVSLECGSGFLPGWFGATCGSGIAVCALYSGCSDEISKEWDSCALEPPETLSSASCSRQHILEQCFCREVSP